LELIKIITTPRGILLISLLIMLIGRYVFKLRYIDCFDIIKKHFGCFKKGNGKISVFSIINYNIVPIFIALALNDIKKIDDSVIEMITIIISILTSMLFTLLTLILTLRDKVKINENYAATESNIMRQLLLETYYSIMFGILLSIIILIMCFVDIFSSAFSSIDSLVIYYLTFSILLNLFMVLKRIFKIIDHDMKK